MHLRMPPLLPMQKDTDAEKMSMQKDTEPEERKNYFVPSLG